MAATDPKKSTNAIGIENNKTNQQYQGKNPKTIPPLPKPMNKSWAVDSLLKADENDKT